MSDLFNNVMPGDTVHYSTPQGQMGRGKVVMNQGTHLVLNAGGRYGRPQVVSDRNYIKHSRGGKVVGALLSRLSQVKEGKAHDLPRTGTDELDDSNTPSVKATYDLDPKLKAKLTAKLLKKDRTPKVIDKNFRKWVKVGSDKPQDPLLRRQHAQRLGVSTKRSMQKYPLTRSEEVELSEGNVPKVHGFENFKNMAHDWACCNDRHNGGRPLLHQKTVETDKVLHQTISIGHHQHSGNPYVIGVFNHLGGPNSETGHGTHHHHTQVYPNHPLGEDSHDAEGASARVAKTKRKKRLNELSNKKLTNYVTKAIADRKKAGRNFAIAAMDHYTATPSQDKSIARIDKRSKGIEKALGKIADRVFELDTSTLVSYTNKAISDHAHQKRMASYFKKIRAPLAAEYHTAKAERRKKGVDTAVTKTDARNESEEIKEARNEREAHSLLAGKSREAARGYYLMRDGRKLSGPHTSDEASKAYKNLGGTDPKGIKIVNVKEAAEEDKVKKAAAKAISLVKKAKGNKHVDTQPKLDLKARSETSTIEDNHQEENDGKL